MCDLWMNIHSLGYLEYLTKIPKFLGGRICNHEIRVLEHASKTGKRAKMSMSGAKQELSRSQVCQLPKTRRYGNLVSLLSEITPCFLLFSDLGLSTKIEQSRATRVGRKLYAPFYPRLVTSTSPSWIYRQRPRLTHENSLGFYAAHERLIRHQSHMMFVLRRMTRSENRSAIFIRWTIAKTQIHFIETELPNQNVSILGSM